MSTYSYVGIFFGVAVCLCFYAGWWADRRWNLTPWMEILGVIFGAATGFRELYRLSRRALKEDK